MEIDTNSGIPLPIMIATYTMVLFNLTPALNRIYHMDKII